MRCLLACAALRSQITPEQIKAAVAGVLKENEARLKEERCVSACCGCVPLEVERKGSG